VHQRRALSSAGTSRLRWASVLGAGLAALLVLVHPVTAQLPAPAVTAGAPFVWGGYASVTFNRPTRPTVDGKRYDVSELAAALMAWGEISTRASYFVEMDMAKRTYETWTGREAEHDLIPVRLYLEYAANDLLRLRVGRFLTPIGQWNEIHAEPLTWTPMRPLATYRPFAKSLTGVLLAGEGSLKGHDTGYALFWAPGLDFDHDIESSEESSFVQAIGARVASEIHPDLYLGLSMAVLKRSRPLLLNDSLAEPVELEEDPVDRTLLGADLRWTSTRAEILAEGNWLFPNGEEPYEGGAYLLGALRLVGSLWGVGKGEVYSPVDGREVTTGYGGLTYRHGPHLVVKVGHQFTSRYSHRVPDGWFVSFSSLF